MPLAVWPWIYTSEVWDCWGLMADLDGSSPPVPAACKHCVANCSGFSCSTLVLWCPCASVVQRTPGAEGETGIAWATSNHACGQEWLLHVLRQACTWQVMSAKREVGASSAVCGDTGRELSRWVWLSPAARFQGELTVVTSDLQCAIYSLGLQSLNDIWVLFSNCFHYCFSKSC